MLWWLPLVSGAVLLLLCSVALVAALGISDRTCLPQPGLRGLGDHAAFQLGIWNASGLGSALALVLYAVVCLMPYALVSGCVRLAARGRTTLFLAVHAIVGTVFIALYDAFGFWAAYDDFSHSSFLCGIAFDLLPIGGLIAGACAATAGSLIALLIQWRARVRT
jgi:hypothetical protein